LGLLIQLIISGVTIGFIYVAIAMGLTMVYGVLRILHIAHAGVYALGAYTGLTVYANTGNILAAAVSAMGVSILVGHLIQKYVYSPVLDKPPLIPLTLSVAVFLLASEMIGIVWGYYPLGFHTGIPFATYSYGEISITSYQILVIFATLSSVLLVWILLNRTRIGLASRAVAQDQEMVQAMGVNVKNVVAFNFIVGSALAGLGGVLVGIYYSQVSPYMGGLVAYKGLVVIVLGGFGSVIGAVVGGLILGLSETLLVSAFGYLLPRESFAFLVLILLLLFRPQGLFGRRVIDRT
jgi:branched-chain amino acid transport system permease protein